MEKEVKTLEDEEIAAIEARKKGFERQKSIRQEKKKREQDSPEVTKLKEEIAKRRELEQKQLGEGSEDFEFYLVGTSQETQEKYIDRICEQLGYDFSSVSWVERR
jgi:hypothetical protein